MTQRLLAAVTLACGTLVLGSTGGASAATMTCADNGSGYCSLGSSGNYGSVTVTSVNSTTYDVTFSLSVGQIADPLDASVAFDITGSNLHLSIVNSGTSDPSGWNSFITNGNAEIDGDEPGAPGTTFGTFQDGVSCSDFNGCGSSVEVQITGTGLHLASNSKNFFAAIDTQYQPQFCFYNGYCFDDGQLENGAVAEGLPVSPTPLPATLPLFAGGLGMIGFIGRRKKRKTADIAA